MFFVSLQCLKRNQIRYCITIFYKEEKNMKNDNEREINKYLGFVIKHYNLTNETVGSLKKKFDNRRFETKTRV